MLAYFQKRFNLPDDHAEDGGQAVWPSATTRPSCRRQHSQTQTL